LTRGELERGTRLGKYEIHGRLSVGGMAELYLASLSGAGGFRKFVALKRVLPSIAENEDFLRMFLDEARITASLSHSAIAQVFELAEDPQTKEPILVMEFVAGQNLEQLSVRAKARKVTLPVGFTARVAYEVLMGLHSAHGFVEPATGKPMPVIHRDINPRNVMVTYTGGTKIIDFGIAKARGRLNQTQAGFVKGTLQYMAPEQVTAKDVDARTDLFSASVLFYELLTGKRLFDDGSDAVIMQRVVKGEIPHLAREAPHLDDELADVIMKGLERDPARRWKNGREYARALDAAVPELFDDQQVSEFMARLFEDKIAVTRGLLSSSTTQASVADLRLMTMMGEEPEQATSIARPKVTEATEVNLDPVTSSPTMAVLPKTVDEVTLTPAPPPRRKTAEAPRRKTADVAKPKRAEAPSNAGLYAIIAVLVAILLGAGLYLLR
jgi:serine/threonine-protein kinase